ncbi:MAG: helix-turn-helix transcriptional regulator [Alphaproteobacteria bacterium]|nr:helix-turn-helix transcriptional regulator [Alphaproteobacteria bacterium]
MQMSYHEIWNGLEQLAAAKGLSLSGLAQKAGLDPTSFNKSKRIGADGRKRWPSTESMNKVLKATNTTVFEFMEYAGQPLPAPHYTIPLLGLAKAGRDGYFDSDGYPLSTADWDGIDFPMQLAKGVYALEVSGDSMIPVYREGDKLVVQPDSEIRAHDRIVVKLVSGEVMVKELKHKSAKQITLKSLNPQNEDIVLHPTDILWMARVIWVSQ